jgi:hypothetical protein
MTKRIQIAFAVVAGAFLLLPMAARAALRVDGTQLQSASTVGVASGEVNASGERQSSGHSSIVLTFGQALVAKGSLAGDAETAVKIGVGYPYNVLWNSPYGCSCPHQGDSDNDTHRTVVDLSVMIDAVFFGGPVPQDPLCPVVRFDVDCDGLVSAVDLAKAIDYVFYDGAPACNPCAN